MHNSTCLSFERVQLVSLRSFPTGVENMGGFCKIWWGGLKSIHGESIGEGWFKMLSKNTCKGVHLIVKLLAIILQAYKSTKNELLHTHFSRILGRFLVIIYCAFTRNHFMKGCFTFQWGEGGGVFQMGASFLSGGVPHRGEASVLMGDWKKS